MITDPKKDKLFQQFKKGVYYAETLDGLLTKHQSGSSAAGNYGIRFSEIGTLLIFFNKTSYDCSKIHT